MSASERNANIANPSRSLQHHLDSQRRLLEPLDHVDLAEPSQLNNDLALAIAGGAVRLSRLHSGEAIHGVRTWG
jgi:hypothetical protein